MAGGQTNERKGGTLKIKVPTANRFDEWKNRKHLKEALGHLRSFKTKGLSRWNKIKVNGARLLLEEAIKNICTKTLPD